MQKILLALVAILLAPSATFAEMGPKRIASFCLGCDEILWELFKNDRKNIVGLSQLADDPLYSSVAEEVPHALARMGDDLEYVAQIKPDLVVIASYNRAEIPLTLRKLKIPFIILENFHNLADIRQNITTLGKATGKTQEAEALVRSIDNDLVSVTRPPPAARKPTVLNFSSDGTLWGQGSLFDEIVSNAGGINIASQIGIKGWPVVNQERIASLNPDFIVTAPEDAKARVFASTPGWKQLPAVRSNKIVAIPSPWLNSASHHVVKAIVLLNKSLYAP
jgi:iron complex transport system substrate-binding protein